MNYAYLGLFEVNQQEKIVQILMDDARQIDAALNSYLALSADILLLGKSLGCFLVAHLTETMARACGTVWLTPNISYAPIWAAITHHKSSFIGMGKIDKYYQSSLPADISQHGNIALSLQPDLDHGLEAAGDVEKTITQQGALIADLNRWMKEPPQKESDLL